MFALAFSCCGLCPFGLALAVRVAAQSAADYANTTCNPHNSYYEMYEKMGCTSSSALPQSQYEHYPIQSSYLACAHDGAVFAQLKYGRDDCKGSPQMMTFRPSCLNSSSPVCAGYPLPDISGLPISRRTCEESFYQVPTMDLFQPDLCMDRQRFSCDWTGKFALAIEYVDVGCTIQGTVRQFIADAETCQPFHAGDLSTTWYTWACDVSQLGQGAAGSSDVGFGNAATPESSSNGCAVVILCAVALLVGRLLLQSSQ